MLIWIFLRVDDKWLIYLFKALNARFLFTLCIFELIIKLIYLYCASQIKLIRFYYFKEIINPYLQQ